MVFDINSAKVVEDNEPQFDINSATDTNETEIIYDQEQDKTIEAPVGLKPREITYLDAVQNKRENPDYWLGGVKVTEDPKNSFWDKLFTLAEQDKTLYEYRKPALENIVEPIGRGLQSLGTSISTIPETGIKAISESTPEALFLEQADNPNIITLTTALIPTQLNYLFGEAAPESFDKATKDAEQALVNAKAKQEYIAAQIPDNRVARNIFKGSQVAGQVGGAIASTLTFKDPKVAIGMLTTLQATDTYKEQREAGVSPNEALARATGDALFTAYTEKLGANFTLSNLTGLKKRIVKTLLEGSNNAAQEWVQSVGNDAVNQNIRKQTIEQIIDNANESAIFGGIFGAAAGATVGNKNPLTSKEFKDELARKTDVPVEVVDAVVGEIDKNKAGIADTIAEMVAGFNSENLYPATQQDIAKVFQAADEGLDLKSVSELVKAGADFNEAISITRKESAANAEQQKILSTLEAEAQTISRREVDLMQPQITDTDPQVIKARIKKLDSDLAALDDRIDAQQDIISERFKAGKSTKGAENKLDKLLTDRETIATELGGLETADRRNVASKGEQSVTTPPQKIKRLINGIRSKKYLAPDMVKGLKAQLVKEVNNYIKENPSVKQNYKDSFTSALTGISDLKSLKRKAALLDSALTRSDRLLRSPSIEEDYQQVANYQPPSLVNRTFTNIGDTMNSVGRIFDNAFAPVSGVLERISPKLKAQLRQYEYEHFNKANEWAKQNETWFKVTSKLPSPIKAQLDYAMKNGDADKINEIAQEYDLVDEFATLRTTLDGIIKELNDNGIKVPYRENYYPRSIKDIPKFMEYIRGQEGWAYLSEAIDMKERELERGMTEEEMAQFVNNYLRYGPEDIKKTDIKFAQLKERTIERISPELNEFYNDSAQSLLMYFKSASHAVSAARFFGKGNVEKVGTNLEASVGKFILDKMSSGELTPAQASRVAEILRARFKEAKTHELMGAIKNLSYASTMGQLTSAVTQIGDLGLAIYRNGFLHSAVGFGKTITGVNKLGVKDIGVENILQEFSDNTFSSKVLGVVFRANLLRFVDRLGKETIINGSVGKFRKLAKKPNEQFLSDMDNIFGDKANQVIEDLKLGVTSEEVKLLAFNDLLENQPVTESEMPLYYLKHPNGRIFYMLKSYTLKVLDIYRKDVFDLVKTNPAQAVTNLTRLTVLLAAFNAAASEIKDWLLGEEVEFSDNVISALLSSLGISKWDIIIAKKEGVTEAVAQKLAPPTALFKTIEQIATGDEKAVRAVPVVGGILYKQQQKEDKERKSNLTPSQRRAERIRKKYESE